MASNPQTPVANRLGARQMGCTEAESPNLAEVVEKILCNHLLIGSLVCKFHL